MSFEACHGSPIYVGALDEPPTARELHFNVVKLTIRAAQRLIDAKRVSVQGTTVFLDDEPLYERVAKRK